MSNVALTNSVEEYGAVLGIRGAEAIGFKALISQTYAPVRHPNPALGSGIFRSPTDEIKSTVDNLANALDLIDDFDRHSGGQKQCVAMGRATVGPPEVFLFDEPCSNLDAKQSTPMCAEPKRFHTRIGTPPIYGAPHRLGARALADGFQNDHGYDRGLYFTGAGENAFELTIQKTGESLKLPDWAEKKQELSNGS